MFFAFSVVLRHLCLQMHARLQVRFLFCLAADVTFFHELTGQNQMHFESLRCMGCSFLPAGLRIVIQQDLRIGLYVHVICHPTGLRRQIRPSVHGYVDDMFFTAR